MKSKSLTPVSVILCTYNGAHYLRKQLDSILNQTHIPNEIIIVDDCSSDETRDIIEEYIMHNSFIKLFVNEENYGSTKSFKKAMTLANCDHIALCDQDDIWLNNKLERQIFEMKKVDDRYSPIPIVIFHDSMVISNDDTVIASSFFEIRGIKPNYTTFRDILINNIIVGCTTLINKQMRDLIVKCDMESIIMHDYLIALIAYGFGKAIYIDEKLILYRNHTQSVTEKNEITLNYRVRNFWQRFKSNEYLLPMIEQGMKYDNIYGDKLDLEKRKLLSKFVKLKNSSIYKKILFRWRWF